MLLERIRCIPAFIPCIEVTFTLRVRSPKAREYPAVSAGAVCDRANGREPAFTLVTSNAVKSSGAGM